MKKSEIYKTAQNSVLRDALIPEYLKLEILRELMSAEDLELYREKKAEEEDKDGKDANKESEDNSEDEGEKCPKCGKPLDECECDDENLFHRCFFLRKLFFCHGIFPDFHSYRHYSTAV